MNPVRPFSAARGIAPQFGGRRVNLTALGLLTVLGGCGAVSSQSPAPAKQVITADTPQSLLPLANIRRREQAEATCVADRLAPQWEVSANQIPPRPKAADRPLIIRLSDFDTDAKQEVIVRDLEATHQYNQSMIDAILKAQLLWRHRLENETKPVLAALVKGFVEQLRTYSYKTVHEACPAAVDLQLANELRQSGDTFHFP